MSALTDRLEIFTYDYIKSQALARISDDYDKRPDGIIDMLLQPFAYELANIIIELRHLALETYITTAQMDESIDSRAGERGIRRHRATAALRKGIFTDRGGDPATLAIGTRFSVIGGAALTYVIERESSPPEPGVYYLRCEQTGSMGNEYIGAIVPLGFIQPLGTAELTSIIIPGTDNESNEDYKARYAVDVMASPFAGNISAYDLLFKDLDGVGDVQVYPVWQGGGTVKISVVDDLFNAAAPELLTILQDMVDPEPQGLGLGFAPINHMVTIVAPDIVTVDITADAVIAGGYSLPAVQDAAKAEIEAYLLAVRKEWGVPDEMNRHHAEVFLAQVESAILRAPGMSNVKNLLINGAHEDIILTQTAAIQQIPYMGYLTLTVA